MPSHFSVQSPTILQPFKLLSSSYKKSYLLINAIMMTIKRKNTRRKWRNQRMLLSSELFLTHMVELEASPSACLRSGCNDKRMDEVQVK